MSRASEIFAKVSNLSTKQAAAKYGYSERTVSRIRAGKGAYSPPARGSGIITEGKTFHDRVMEMSVKEAADALGVSTRTVSRIRAGGEGYHARISDASMKNFNKEHSRMRHTKGYRATYKKLRQHLTFAEIQSMTCAGKFIIGAGKHGPTYLRPQRHPTQHVTITGSAKKALITALGTGDSQKALNAVARAFIRTFTNGAQPSDWDFRGVTCSFGDFEFDLEGVAKL